MKVPPGNATALGQHFYLFQKTPGQPSKKLIITSHGAFVPGMHISVPANTSLVFYGPDGKTLTDPGLGAVMRGEIQPHERKGPASQVRNYLLSKYSDDQYSSIAYGVKLEGVDVLTVRNRKAPTLLLQNSTLSLNDALAELGKSGIQYDEIHCVFCRNFLLNPKPETHVAPRVMPIAAPPSQPSSAAMATVARNAISQAAAQAIADRPLLRSLTAAPSALWDHRFTLDLKGLAHDLQVLEFSGREAISQPYRFTVELVSERPDLDLDALINRPAYLAFSPDGLGIHGVVDQVYQGDSGKRLTRYRLVIVPRLAYLAHRVNQRIFQHLTVPQIIGQVLEEHGILAGDYQFQLGPTVYPERDYCVQYDESDLHFIQRLCEEEGLHYHFQHSADGHVLVFGDDQSVFPKLGQPTAYVQDGGLVADEPVIKRFKLRLETRSARVSKRDYNFETPRLLLETAAKQDAPIPDLEDYDYPGRYAERSRGRHLSKRALERHRADYRLAEGRSDQPKLVSGHFLEISDHPNPAWNALWLLTEVRHQGKQPQVLEESVLDHPSPSGRGAGGEGNTDSTFTQGYRNTFLATPWDVPYRPPLAHPKPRILGSQSAVVTGPAGEEIHCDEYGRVKVQFHWDREGQADEHTSCWLRVASSWAGDLYGGIAIPRIGMEVVVTFLEGDPDQPLITGCLYHKEHVVPYDLPANKTRSLFKTLSSPGGGGYNELRIEDRKGAEQIYIHAERDWDENIENDQKIRVGHERHDTVEANSYTELLAEEHLTVKAERKVEVKPNDHLTVGENQHIKLGTAQLTKAGREIHLKAGQKLVIEAGIELTIKAGGSFIKLDPGGITINGPLAKLNAGGSPGKGSGIKILRPVLPGAADQDGAGEVLKQAQPNAAQPIPRKFKRMLSFSG